MLLCCQSPAWGERLTSHAEDERFVIRGFMVQKSVDTLLFWPWVSFPTPFGSVVVQSPSDLVLGSICHCSPPWFCSHPLQPYSRVSIQCLAFRF
jgi:hypothetical protein